MSVLRVAGAFYEPRSHMRSSQSLKGKPYSTSNDFHPLHLDTICVGSTCGVSKSEACDVPGQCAAVGDV